MVKTFYCFLLLLITISSIYAQSFRFEHIDVTNGLSQSSIYDIKQDHDGFIWVCTEDGLNRYDGFKFDIFRNIPNDSTSLPINGLRQILIHSNGNIYITHHEGISLFNAKTETFINYYLRPYKSFRNSVFEDSKKQVWLYNRKGLFLLKDTLEAQILIPNIRQIIPKNNQIVYMMTDDSVYTLDLEKHQKIQILYAQKGAWLNNMYKDNQGNLWFSGAQPEIVCIRTNGEKRYITSSNLNQNVIEDKTSDYHYTRITQDLHQNIWISTEKGVGKYDSITNTYVIHPIKSNEEMGTTNSGAISLLCDKTGILWLGTYESGLYKINPYRFRFPNYQPHLTIKKPFPGTNITSFGEGKNENEIWVGTNNGVLCLWHKKEDTFEGVVVIPEKASIMSILINPIKKQEIWLGTRIGLFIYDTNTKKLTYIKPSRPTFLHHITCFKMEQGGNVWFCSLNGLACWHTQTNQWEYFETLGENKIAYHIEPYKTDNWLVGTDNGIYLFNKITKTAEKLHISPTIDKNQVVHINPVSDEEVWITATGQGLVKCDFGKHNYIQYNTLNGLPNNDCYASLLDKNGDIWTSHNNGISKWDRKTNTFRNYDVNDGLQSNEYIGHSALVTQKGDLLFGGINGFNCFQPNELIENTYVPNILITSFSVFDKKQYNTYQLAQEKPIELSYKDNFFSIDFLAIDFGFPSKNQYKYKLENYDDKWVVAGNKHTARYTGVPPGKYTFKVIGSNNDGKWTEKEASLIIIIKPPFWQTWTFRAALFIFIIAIIYYLWHQQIQRIKQREAIRQQITELENKALRAQMNPHFIFNALNSIQDFILDHNAKDASKYLNKFAKLIRLMLDNSEQTFVSLQKELDLLTYYVELERLRFNHNFEFILEKSADINIWDTSIPTMMIQPHVENAIWHGLQHKKEEGTLWLRFRLLDEHQLVCEVEDDGIGREAAKLIRQNNHKGHASKGLGITEHRLNLFKNAESPDVGITMIDKYDSEGNATGTKVIITLPFK